MKFFLSTALNRPLIHDEVLKDLVWSCSSVNNEENEQQGINDLIGISDSSVFIWDPIQACEPMEMRFGFDQDTKISCIDASSMSNHLFVIGTSTGLAFTPDSQSTPLQVSSYKQGRLIIFGIILDMSIYWGFELLPNTNIFFVFIGPIPIKVIILYQFTLWR